MVGEPVCVGSLKGLHWDVGTVTKLWATYHEEAESFLLGFYAGHSSIFDDLIPTEEDFEKARALDDVTKAKLTLIRVSKWVTCDGVRGQIVEDKDKEFIVKFDGFPRVGYGVCIEDGN